jgi:hypothetical protein
MMLHIFSYFSEFLQRNVYDVVRDKKENVLTDQRRFTQLILKMAAKDYDHLFKLLIIGDSGVGKSSLLVR